MFSWLTNSSRVFLITSAFSGDFLLAESPFIFRCPSEKTSSASESESDSWKMNPKSILKDIHDFPREEIHSQTCFSQEAWHHHHPHPSSYFPAPWELPPQLVGAFLTLPDAAALHVPFPLDAVSRAPSSPGPPWDFCVLELFFFLFTGTGGRHTNAQEVTWISNYPTRTTRNTFSGWTQDNEVEEEEDARGRQNERNLELFHFDHQP